MANIIKIPTEPIEQVLSQPYKTDTVGYFVNIFNGRSKASKRKFNFPDKGQAAQFYTDNSGKWRIDFTDLSGNLLADEKSLLFDSRALAYSQYAKLMSKNKEVIENTEDDVEDIVIEQLERTFEQYLPSLVKSQPKRKSNFSDLPKFDDEDEDEEHEKEHDEDVLQAEEKYIQASSIALTEAKSLLGSIAELYIEKGVIEKFPYFKNKLYFEENSIQMIHTQMMISQLVLKKFFKQVIKNPTAKNIESLSKIQMSQLALSKYQREYLSDVEESFKKLKKDYVNGEFVNQSGIEEGEVIIPDTPVFNDRKKLIMELSEVVEADDLIPLSPNQNLRNNIKDNERNRYETSFKIHTQSESSKDEEILVEKNAEDIFSSFMD